MKLFNLLVILSTYMYGADAAFVEEYINSLKPDIILKNDDNTTIAYSTKLKQPLYTYVKIDKEHINIKRKRSLLCKFTRDKRISKKLQANLETYRGSGFDRGHLASFATSDSTTISAKQSCLFSNITPQYPHFNRIVWRKVESDARDVCKKLGECIIITVSFFDNNPFNDKFINKIKIADGFIKIVTSVDGGVVKLWFIEHKKKVKHNALAF